MTINLMIFVFAQVCETIQNELGKSMDDLFINFDRVPLATASVSS